MLDFPWLKRKQPALAGVYLSHSAVALAAVCRPTGVDGSGAAEAFRCMASPIQGGGEISASLQTQKATLGLEKTDCTLVLAPDFYTLSLIERPPVAEQELKDAVRWKIQEYLEFPAEEAVVDVFPLPQVASRGHSSMIFVVAVQKSKLKTLVHAVSSTGLHPTAIDIAELSLRTLAESLFPEADSAVGLLRITANNGVINISRGDELFLSRRITGVPSDFDEVSWNTFKDMMLLQVQRSIDYYESALSQGAAQVLLVAATHEWQSRIVDYLAEMLPLGVRDLPEYLCDQFDLELFNPEPRALRSSSLSSEDKQALAAAIPALGGALRSAQSALPRVTAPIGEAGVQPSELRGVSG